MGTLEALHTKTPTASLAEYNKSIPMQLSDASILSLLHSFLLSVLW